MPKPIKPVMLRIDTELIDRVDEIVREVPVYDGNRSHFIRQAIRELLDRVNAERTQTTDGEAA